MKTTLILFFLIFTLNVYSQTSDILYLPKDKSLLVTYRGSGSFGFYLGGSIRTQFDQPFIYTTPLSIFNRAGLNITYRNKVSVLGGVLYSAGTDTISIKPEIWLKINPFRIILKSKTIPDFSFCVTYNKKFNYGLGLSIPFQGIY